MQILDNEKRNMKPRNSNKFEERFGRQHFFLKRKKFQLIYDQCKTISQKTQSIVFRHKHMGEG
jgi:hypothetical protein